MKVVAYIRVSTDDQHLGPEAQRAAIATWAEREKSEVIATFEDLGVSGAAPIDERPGLLDALESVKENGATALVVAKRDRLARDVIVGAMVERMFSQAGAAILSADGVGAGDGPEAALMRRMLDAFAEYERAIIRARTRAAINVKRKRGEYLGGRIPAGRRIGADGRKLEENADEAETIRIARQMREEGNSLREISAALACLGRVARGGKPYGPGAIRAMVQQQQRQAA